VGTESNNTNPQPTQEAGNRPRSPLINMTRTVRDIPSPAFLPSPGPQAQWSG